MAHIFNDMGAGFREIGMDKRKKSEIMTELINELQNPYNEELLGSYDELEKEYKIAVRRQMKKGTGQFYKQDYYISKCIRDKVKMIFSRLEATVSSETLDNVSAEEIKEMIRFLLGMRNDPFDVFFRKPGKPQNGLRRLNTVIKKGLLVRNYEGLYLHMINKWNAKKGERKEYSLKNVFTRNVRIETLKEMKSEILESILQKDYERVWEKFNSVSFFCKGITFEIQSLERYGLFDSLPASPALLRAIMFLDFLMGYNRDLLIMQLKLLDETEGIMIVDRYIECAKEILKVENENGKNYSLLEDYLIGNTFYSLANERAEWVEIQNFLIDEITNGVQPVAETIFVREKVEGKLEKIRGWLQYIRIMNFESDKETLYASIHKECYLYTSRPKGVFGVDGFLKYIEKETNRKNDNMSYEEMFYYEKILRGIFRENGHLDEYVYQKLLIKNVYLLESNFFSRRDLSGRYIGRCAEVLCNAMLKTFKETYKILMTKMPLD